LQRHDATELSAVLLVATLGRDVGALDFCRRLIGRDQPMSDGGIELILAGLGSLAFCKFQART
jgi:hypothetical protein